ncbi:alcohol dehydrogenase catalytic domain-containing protein [Streptomyces sp. RS10V-4]|uniref:alcohol dehydrogenase catalytic domain-containing protein n=1 Tax=Streptomyces rhizoryzae TaxID=2932493 RepID=UPI0020031365|nr:alcohol dehydrogenase catalytic domain-containing protein [Streptomyces rhizoryzae]MCK7622983.1 alcohol dehydrogenase catalytic domain-containing protein [Streptomyces rhizoryzae]
MRAVVLHGVGDVRVEEVPRPRVEEPSDALVRVVAAAVCGSDLSVLRGRSPLPRPIRSGHEFVGVVEDVGAEVTAVRPGQFVIAPFSTSCGGCAHCRRGQTIACEQGMFFGEFGPDGSALDGGQAEYVRVPLADSTLVGLAQAPPDALVPHLLALTDVLPTGHEAAVHAGVRPGATVVVVGDGAVGQCAVLASRRLGAERIVVMSRHPERQRLARAHGATDVVAGRGEEGAAEVAELLGGGSGHVIEAVGSLEAVRQAIGCARPGGRIGYVGLPWDVSLPLWELFGKNLCLSGGGANVRATLPGLLPEVLAGTLRPGGVFDAVFPLAGAVEAFGAMDTRRCVKAVLRP